MITCCFVHIILFIQPLRHSTKKDYKDDYILINNIDIRSHSLFINYRDGKLTYEVIPLIDVSAVKIAEQMLWIIDNFKTLYYRFK